MRVGDIGLGPCATVDHAGSVRPLGGTNAKVSVQWWVGSEQRWHVPELEASCRQGRLDAMPVLETRIKVPGGEAVANTFAVVLPRGERRRVVFEVRNSAVVPFAVGWVVVSDSPMTTDGSSVWVDGVELLSLPRPAARFGFAESSERLREHLDVEEFVDRPEGAVVGALALIVPVPHKVAVVALVDPRLPRRSRRRRVVTVAESWERSDLPSATQVASGWRLLVSRGARFEWGDVTITGNFDAARGEVAMGPESTADVIELAAVVTACARLGWLDEVDEMFEAMLNAQKLDGRVDSTDPTEATRRLLEAATALWTAGVSVSRFELLVGPIAKAGHWLARGRRAPQLTSAGAVALMAIVPALREIGQPDVADDFESFARVCSDASPIPAGTLSDLTRAADGIVAGVDSMVRETADGLDVFAGWSAGEFGVSLEAHDVATRWGNVSVAMRWHDQRPALLRELTPHPERPQSCDVTPIWRAPSLDGGWSSNSSNADVLLAPAPERETSVQLRRVERTSSMGNATGSNAPSDLRRSQ